MLTLMVAFMSIAMVGATVTMQLASAVPDTQAAEAPIAANFVRYTNAVKCYAHANPAFQGNAPDIVTLKATNHLGAPCLHPAINFVGDYRGLITATHVMVYQPTGLTVRAMAMPVAELGMYAMRYEVTGIVGADGTSIVSTRGNVVGQVPPELAALTPPPGVGAPVRVLAK